MVETKGAEYGLVNDTAKAATGNTVDFYFPRLYDDIIFCLDVSGVPAVYTDETLDVTIETKDPKSGEYDTVVTFTQITDTAGVQWKYAADTNKKLGNIIRVKWTISGTAPDYDLSLTAICK